MIDADVRRMSCLVRRQKIVLEAIIARIQMLNEALDVPPAVLVQVVRAYPWTPDAHQWQADLRRLLRSKRLISHRPFLQAAMQIAQAQAADLTRG